LLKEAAGAAAPMIKKLLEQLLTPNVTKLLDTYKRKKKLEDFIIFDKFSEYLNESYTKFSIVNTLVFRNQQRFLDSIYIPLHIFVEDEEQTEFLIDQYPQGLIEDFHRILITDTAGMGKSTLLKKLFKSIVESQKGIPFLIELRRLDKDKDIVSEMLAQLKPINEGFDKELLLDLIKMGGFIFLFDGFDEIPLDQRQAVTAEMQKFITKAGNNYFIISSRPETALTSFGDFMSFKIKPLEMEEAYELLRRYNDHGPLAELLITKLKDSNNGNIKEFLTNPLLVSLLYAAFEHKQTIPFKKHIFYRQVFDALFESHDLTKGDSYERGKMCRLDIDEFHRVLRHIGYKCLVKGEIEFSKDELLSLIKQAKEFTTLPFSQSYFLQDLTNAVPLFVVDGVYYKWAHKSLQEYFAAQFIYLDAKANQKDILLRLSTHPDIQQFYNTLDLFYSIDIKTFREVIVYDLLTRFKKYKESSYQYVRSASDRYKRQILTFTRDYVLVRLSEERGDRDFLKALVLLAKTTPKKEGVRLLDEHATMKTTMDLPILDRIDQINGRAVYSIRIGYLFRSDEFLLAFLFLADEDFVKVYVFDKGKDTTHLILTDNEPLLVEDRKDSILNKEDNFEKVNKILEYLSRSVYVIDEKAAAKTLRDIETAINNQKLDSLLDF